jgi:hypothetical protein
MVFEKLQSVIEEHSAVGTGKFWPCTAEMCAEVTQAGSLQDRVHDCVQDGVAIAVPGEALFPWPLQSREVERFCGIKLMNIHRHCDQRYRGSTQQRFSPHKVIRVGDFESPGMPVHAHNIVSCTSEYSCVIREFFSGIGIGPSQCLDIKPLRSLHGTEFVTIDTTLCRQRFDPDESVNNRHVRDNSDRPCLEGIKHPIEDVAGHQGSSGIVNKDMGRAGRKGTQALLNAVTPGLPTDHHVHRVHAGR